jgi:hypothetical protein
MNEFQLPGLPDYPPEFEVGDYVMLYNPYFDEFILTEDNEFVLYEVDAIMFDLKDRVYRYRLSVDGESDGLWYNEHWLQPDIFGPLAIRLDFEEAKGNGSTCEAKEWTKKIDGLLDEYNDYKRLVDEFGDEEYRARLAEIEAELIMLTGGERE